MKRVIALVLLLALVLCGCGNSVNVSKSVEVPSEKNVNTKNEDADTDDNDSDTDNSDENKEVEAVLEEYMRTEEEDYEYQPEFDSLADEELLAYVEDNVYEELVSTLDSEEYFVENVSAVYVSKEYLEEKEYNSKTNIFFGYKLEEIEEAYSGQRYVFTVNKEGKTIVTNFEDYDDTYDRIIKNVAIGSGVILLCVTVTCITGGTGAVAASMIFAASAKSATVLALSSAGFGALAAGITTQIETGDVSKALKSAALEGSEGFKWGAIIGAMMGGSKEYTALKGATLNGLTMNEAAQIQKQTKWPLSLIKQFKSIEEANVYMNAGLKEQIINGRMALVQNIDPDYVVGYKDGKAITNLDLMKKGLAPFDAETKEQFVLHHVNQEKNGYLAILKKESEHQGKYSLLHDVNKEGVHNALTGDKTWDATRKKFWRAFAKQFIKNT